MPLNSNQVALNLSNAATPLATEELTAKVKSLHARLVLTQAWTFSSILFRGILW